MSILTNTVTASSLARRAHSSLPVSRHSSDSSMGSRLAPSWRRRRRRRCQAQAAYKGQTTHPLGLSRNGEVPEARRLHINLPSKRRLRDAKEGESTRFQYVRGLNKIASARGAALATCHITTELYQMSCCLGAPHGQREQEGHGECATNANIRGAKGRNLATRTERSL